MTKQTYQLRNEQILSNAINHLRNTPLNPDKPYFVTIQEATRSLSQNAKLWCCLTDISEQRREIINRSDANKVKV